MSHAAKSLATVPLSNPLATAITLNVRGRYGDSFARFCIEIFSHVAIKIECFQARLVK